MTNLEALRRGMVGEGPRAGWQETIGARIAQVEPGSVVVELDVHAGHRHDGGVVQGGVITQIADAAMGMSLMTKQEDGLANTTIELKINFLRPVVEGRLRAVGRIVEMRSSLLFSEADVLDAEGRLVARASSTCLAIERPSRRRP
ncbi:MAG: PaaI family thioesterase [Candidatus Dormibacteraeota bacterium]|nr:PaaI family thioesterase [Candidatus Dormibacteraeota bacterium]MDQ6920635.1 PaaI family thioesterase [Candidatus Dormibacteraeota bacterium]